MPAFSRPPMLLYYENIIRSVSEVLKTHNQVKFLDRHVSASWQVRIGAPRGIVGEVPQPLAEGAEGPRSDGFTRSPVCKVNVANDDKHAITFRSRHPQACLTGCRLYPRSTAFW